MRVVADRRRVRRRSIVWLAVLGAVFAWAFRLAVVSVNRPHGGGVGVICGVVVAAAVAPPIHVLAVHVWRLR